MQHIAKAKTISAEYKNNYIGDIMYSYSLNYFIKLSAVVIIVIINIVQVASAIAISTNGKGDIEVLKHLQSVQRCLEEDAQIVVIQYENYYSTTGLQFLKQLLTTKPILLMDNRKLYEVSGLQYRKTKYIFIFIEELEDLSSALNFNTRNTWAAANYTIVVSKPFKSNDTTLNDIMEFFVWKAKIFNFIVIFYEDKLKIVTYNPFTKEIINFSSFNSCNMYPDKIKNLYQYELKVSMFLDPPQIMYFKNGKPYGPDITLLEIIARLMNFSIKYTSPESISNYSPFTDAHVEVISGKTDFCFVNNFVVSITRNAQYTYSIRLNNVVILLSKKSKTNKVHKLLQNLDKFCWICLCFSVLTIALIQYFVANILDKIRKTFLDLLLFTWATLQGVRLPLRTQNTMPAKCLFILWILCALFINFAFQCSMLSIFIQPHKVEYIDTVKELVSNGVATKIRAVLKDKLPQLGLKFIEVDNSYRYQPYRGLNNNTAVAVSERIAKMFIKQNKDLIIVEEYLLQAHTGYYFPLNSPYIEKFNQIIMMSNEFGIIKCIEDLDQSQYKQHTKQLKLLNPLQIIEVVQALYLLIVGYIFATLIFLFEILFSIFFHK